MTCYLIAGFRERSITIVCLHKQLTVVAHPTLLGHATHYRESRYQLVLKTDKM